MYKPKTDKQIKHLGHLKQNSQDHRKRGTHYLGHTGPSFCPKENPSASTRHLHNALQHCQVLLTQNASYLSAFFDRDSIRATEGKSDFFWFGVYGAQFITAEKPQHQKQPRLRLWLCNALGHIWAHWKLETCQEVVPGNKSHDPTP